MDGATPAVRPSNVTPTVMGKVYQAEMATPQPLKARARMMRVTRTLTPYGFVIGSTLCVGARLARSAERNTAKFVSVGGPL